MDYQILSVLLIIIQVVIAEGSTHAQIILLDWSPLVIPAVIVVLFVLVCLGCTCRRIKIRNHQALVDREHGEAGGGGNQTDSCDLQEVDLIKEEQEDKEQSKRNSDINIEIKEEHEDQDQREEEQRENWENELLDAADGAEEISDTCGDEWSPVVIDIFNDNTGAEQGDQEKEPKENWENELLDGTAEISYTCGDEWCSSINMKMKKMPGESPVVIEIFDDKSGAETRSQEENQKSKIKRSWGSRVSLVEQGLLVEESCYDLISC